MPERPIRVPLNATGGKMSVCGPKPSVTPRSPPLQEYAAAIRPLVYNEIPVVEDAEYFGRVNQIIVAAPRSLLVVRI